MLIYYLLTTLHVIVCVILILVVLLQSGKGADIAGAFGGGGTQTAFGSRGPASFLSKLTTAAAVVFMLTCLSLSMMGYRQEAKSVMDTAKTKAAAPASKTPAPTKSTAPAPTIEQIRQMQQEAEAKAKAAAAGSRTASPGNITVTPGKDTVVQQPQAKPEAGKDTKAPPPKKP
jgi:preprotein translocase subunit SecG